MVLGLTIWASLDTGLAPPQCVYAQAGVVCHTCGATTLLGEVGHGQLQGLRPPLAPGAHAVIVLVWLGVSRLLFSGLLALGLRQHRLIYADALQMSLMVVFWLGVYPWV